MKKYVVILLALLLLTGTISAFSEAATLPEAAFEAGKTANQIVAVAWDEGYEATLTLYEKTDSGAWTSSFVTAALVGKNGIGKTREGDAMTPEGTFALSTPFGIMDDPGARMTGYVQVDERYYWSGASGTEDYNRLIDTSKRTDYVPTSNDEHLIDYPGFYDYGMFIEYNKEGVEKAGSAIFLHCIGDKPYTGGCVAIDREHMIQLMQTLNDGAMIVIYRIA